MVILATGITLLLLASALLKRALIPQRIGTTPHCRRCNYNLSGLTATSSTNCPECGLPLSARNVVHGQRPRSRVTLAAALPLGVAGLALIALPAYNPFRSINWYAYKPTFWLLSDLESSDTDVRAHAWTEFFTRDTNHRLSDADRARFDALLVRLYAARSDKLPPTAPDYLLDRFRHLRPEQRTAIFQRLLPDLTAPLYTYPSDSAQRIARLEASNDLSPEHHAQLTTTALAAQGGRNPPVSLDYLLHYLARRELADQLTPEQRDQFFRACANPVLDVRPTVLAGDDIPFYVHYTGRGAQDFGWCDLHMTSGQLDSLAPVPLRGGHEYRNRLPGTRATGPHIVRITFQITAVAGERPFDPAKTPPRWSRQVTLTRPVTVLPPGTDDLTWIDDRSLADPIRNALHPEKQAHASSKSSSQLYLAVGINNAPANFAFDVSIRDPSGKEYPARNFTAYAGETSFTITGVQNFPPGPNVGHIDLVFRSSERAMRNTPDLYEAWRGEIVFPNIPVIPEPPAPSTPPR